VVNFNLATLAPYFRQRQVNIVVNVGTPQMIVGLNGNRVKLVIQTAGANFFLSPFAPSVNPFGLLITNTAAPYEIDFSTWGGIVGMEWYARASAGTASVTGLEVWYEPTGD
jgi:hypothetical protein